MYADVRAQAPEDIPEEVVWQRYVEGCQRLVIETEEAMGASRGEVASVLASEVIEAIFGEDWVASNLAEAKAYATQSNDPEVKRAFLHEEMQLGRYLFDLQPYDFFPDLIAGLRNRHNELRGAMFEAEVVWLLKYIPLQSAIRIPTGIKTNDYDIGVPFGDDEWPIEVKAKEDIAFTPKTLKQTLETARRQLPPGGVGTIFVRIPRTWGDLAAYGDDAETVISDALRSSSRVHAVVLISDAWTTELNQRFQTPRLVARVFCSTDCDPRVKKLLESYQVLWNADPVMFHPVWSRVI
ncbi:hypothetical protein ACFPJ1_27510 [Kribbella qitaiheensis]|uniref:hypothetical protein n=1 Tax=Kribbella qitaiheensis TaxID=1544730 RepID=UPI003623BF9D